MKIKRKKGEILRGTTGQKKKKRFGPDVATTIQYTAIEPPPLRWLFLGPAEILPHELVEPLIVLVEEPPQLGDNHGAYARMPSTFALLQALLRRLVSKAVETFRVVEVEVVPSYPRLQSEEVLDPAQLGHRILDQLVAVHYQDLIP